MAVRIILRRDQCRYELIENSNFLIFIPVDNPGLRAILSYYAASVKVNPEGDVHITDETKQGAGTNPPSRFSLLKLFGLYPKPRIRHRPPDPSVVGPTGTVPSPSSEPAVNSVSEMRSWVLNEDTAEVVQATLSWRSRLTAWVPVSIGYFLAGAMAGIISRTTTAPLDRYVRRDLNLFSFTPQHLTEFR